MKTALAVIAVLALQVTSAPLVRSQTVQRVLIVELHFGHDSAGTPTVELSKETVYWAEVVGRGTPLLKAVKSGRDAFLVPVEDGSEPQGFLIYPLESGLHSVSLADQDSAGGAMLRLYRDATQTARVRSEHERGGIIGFLFAAGVHTGLGVDSIGGTDPRGGSTYEGCLLLQASDRFATCVGGSRQYLPDENSLMGWLFLEERARLFSARAFGNRNTDFGVAARFSKSMGVDSRNTYPGMWGLGLHVTQHLAAAGGRRGVSVAASWQRAWLSGAQNSHDHVTDQFVAGLIWIP